MILSPVIAQAVTDHWETIILGSGPLGGIAWWLSRKVEQLLKALEERDSLIREVAEKNAKAMELVAHRLAGMSRALIYNAATHGPRDIQLLAQKELDRMAVNQD